MTLVIMCHNSVIIETRFADASVLPGPSWSFLSFLPLQVSERDWLLSSIVMARSCRMPDCGCTAMPAAMVTNAAILRTAAVLRRRRAGCDRRVWSEQRLRPATMGNLKPEELAGHEHSVWAGARYQNNGAGTRMLNLIRCRNVVS